MNFDKHYMLDSHWVAVSFSDSGYAEYFNSYVYHPTNSKSWHTCNVTQFLGL